MVNDAPLVFDAGVNGGQPWDPKNFDGTFEGPMPLRNALMGVRRTSSRWRVLQSIGAPAYAQDWVTKSRVDEGQAPGQCADGPGRRLGHADADGGGASRCSPTAATRVNPYLVTRVTDLKDKVLMETEPPALDESRRAIPGATLSSWNRCCRA